MAAPVKRFAAIALLALGVRAVVVMGDAAAAPLSDPTLPPPAATSGKAVVAPASTPVLQLILGAGQSRSALLDGRWVGAGATVTVNGADYTVERVTETSVVLARGAEREVLQIAPAAARAVRCRGGEGRCR